MSALDPSLSRALRLWLYGVAALIAVMVLIGGATRLTESGLSITEWAPVTGTLPPLDEGQWQTEFEKYQTTTRYKELNRGMALAEFKKIYWWEWTHRFLGRLIGIAFALPFLFFALTKNLPRPLLLKLGGILLLGGLQGAIGWWMVASGLAGRVDVAPYRLAIHLTLALIIFAAILSVTFSLDQYRHFRASGNPENKDSRLDPRFRGDDGRRYAWLLLTLIFIQIFLGGLVAGTRAGYTYNTWPLMDGGLVPSGLFAIEPWWRNFFENTALVQFLHRMNAYLILIVVLGFALTKRSRAAFISLLILLAQAGLGIATLLTQMNFALALMHQAGVILITYRIVSITGIHPNKVN